MNSKLAEWFVIEMHVKEGYGMSPWLFNVFIDDVCEVQVRVLERVLNLVKEGESWTSQWLVKYNKIG